jgi:hypothetical protein
VLYSQWRGVDLTQSAAPPPTLFPEQIKASEVETSGEPREPGELGRGIYETRLRKVTDI